MNGGTSGRTIALRVVAVAISVALVGWLLADARWHGVGARLAALDVDALIGVALLFAASYAMRAARIEGEFRDEIVARDRGRAEASGGDDDPRTEVVERDDRVGNRGPVDERDGSARNGNDRGRSDRDTRPVRRYLRILRLTLVHNALVNVLPFRGGEVAFPVLLSRWFGIGTGRAVVSLLWLRAQDATVVLVLAALVWPGLAIAWRVAIVVGVCVGAWAVPWWARRHGLGSTTPDAPATKLERVRALLARSTRRNAAGWLWTIGNWSVKLAAEAWLVGVALGPTDATGAARADGSAVLGAVGAELAAILPIQGVAGFGTFEAGGAALMRTHGVPLQTGLEAVLVLHAVVLALALLAGAVATITLPGRGSGTDRR